MGCIAVMQMDVNVNVKLLPTTLSATATFIIMVFTSIDSKVRRKVNSGHLSMVEKIS